MKTRAFTLIELLFVVATIAILAAISVPNFLEAQVRSKTARAHADMAVLEHGLKVYYADYNLYPQHQPEVHQFLEACSRVIIADAKSTSAPADARFSWTADDPYKSTRPGNNDPYWGESGLRGGYPILVPAAYDMRVLTTPISYIGGQLPADPYQDVRGAPYTYINLSELQTTTTPFAKQGGAFRRYILLSYGPDTDSSKQKFVNPVRGPWISYDPTNGTVSAGDILRFGNGDAGLTSSPLDIAPEDQTGWNPGIMGGPVLPGSVAI